ncbi:hypothetical protein [Bacteroides sp.]|uniref:hypothetical protein n=1 Tax=Bacteroides sp. TaxID=29523 RepID=UPI002A7FA994|nr:hypothetical protein [Bacteroides sp.]
MTEYGYINEGGYLVSKILEDRTERRVNEEGKPEDVVITIAMQAEELVNLGWKPVDMVDDAKLTPSVEFGSIRIQPYDNGDRISYRYIESVSKKLITSKINEYKAFLNDTDYKVMKCYEATLLNLPLPYNIDEVHQTRQEYRDRINELEQYLD